MTQYLAARMRVRAACVLVDVWRHIPSTTLRNLQVFLGKIRSHLDYFQEKEQAKNVAMWKKNCHMRKIMLRIFSNFSNKFLRSIFPLHVLQ